MLSHRSLEGELLIDHRAGAGTDQVPAGQKLECPTLTCCGCQKIMIVNPNRQRPRPYCRRCGTYMCEDCALRIKLGHPHESFKQFADRYLNAAATGKELPRWLNV